VKGIYWVGAAEVKFAEGAVVTPFESVDALKKASSRNPALQPGEGSQGAHCEHARDPSLRLKNGYAQDDADAR
jgi:hypothetical protein